MKRYPIIRAVTTAAILTLTSNAAIAGGPRDTGVDPEKRNSSIAELSCKVFNFGCVSAKKQDAEKDKSDEKGDAKK